MTSNPHDVNAYIIGEKGGVYSMKIEIYDLGVYIHGATIRKSKKKDEWWLQPPKHRKNGKFYADVEFDTSTELWQAMFEACVLAIAEFRRVP